MVRQNSRKTAIERAPSQIESSNIANCGRIRVQVMNWEVASGSRRFNARRSATTRVYCASHLKVRPALHFLLKLTGYSSSTGFGLLLVEAAAVNFNFLSFDDLCSLLFRYTARLICSLGDANAKTNGYFDKTIATATSRQLYRTIETGYSRKVLDRRDDEGPAALPPDKT